jgi:hypothetical protein
MNRINLLPSVWGPEGWLLCDLIFLAYPLNVTPPIKEMYKNFIESLETIIPCHECRLHYKTHIKHNIPSGYVLSSRQNLLEWFINIHNLVRTGTKKKLFDTKGYYEYYNNIKLDCKTYDRIFIFLKSICLSFNDNLDDKTEKHLRYFFALLPQIIDKKLIVFPDNLTKESLTEWINELHNKLRRSFNKEPIIEDISKLYDK